ncbi:MAG TPA: restriction endonuclease subunit S [Symbiobacteriaceae bacterium]|jgi:type I restriction enzyme S subunit
MIQELKPYPAYKDSGVPWLGEVPEHWTLRRTKTLLRERGEKGFPNEPLLTATQTKGVVRKEQYENRTVLALKDLHLLKLVRVGDFVISLRSFQGGIEYAHEQGIISPAYTILYPAEREIHNFLAWLFKSRPYIENLSLFVTGIRQGQNIDYEKLSRSELPVPPLPEQAAIGRFLDHADRRIRRYIRAKQKLITLLNEQKQAIIHRTVTRGLNPNVRLKPSGVEWLGDVPEHWEVAPLRRVTISRCDGPFGSGLKSSHYTDQGIRVVRLQNIGHAEFKDSDAAFISPAHYASLGDHTVEAGDVLIAGLGDERHPAGRACVAPASITPAMVKADCFRFRLDPSRVNSDFAAIHLTATAVSASAILSTGATRQRTNLLSTAARAVCIPPLREQEAIVAGISSDTALLNAAIHGAQSEIDLLREYRTRLIADVVTGKLDVREAAAQLPDDPDPLDEPEPFDEELEEAEDQESDVTPQEEQNL